MLKLDNVRISKEHQLQVHGDDVSPTTFYVIPKHPRFARLENGGLALRFVEYDALRVDGNNSFGGFVAFDVDLSIPEEILNAIRAELDEELAQKFPGRDLTATIAPVPWLGGSVRLILTENGKIVEKISGAATPSLAGNNIACFLLELSQLGTAIFKETLSSGISSGIQVVYSLDHYTRLPKMHAEGVWHAEEFYDYFQDVNTEDNFWSEDSYTEVINETRYKSDVTTTTFDFIAIPGFTAEQQQQFDDSIRNMINTQLAEAVKRNLMPAIAAVDPNVKNLNEDQDIEDIRRTVDKTQIADVRVEWNEARAVIQTLHPQGSLPTVTSLTDKDGNALKWEDYYSKISVDEFLKTILVNAQVNADFDDLPIHSVEVKLRYPHGPNAKTVEKAFTKPDELQKVEFLAHQGNRKYFASYQVNFENSGFVFTSPETETDDSVLTVNVDDLGVLAVDIVDGDINFEQVTRANVRVRYDGADAPIEKFFNIAQTGESHKLREVIRTKRTGPVKYQVTYTMKGDGREITGPELEADSKVIAVNDPFRSIRTITFRAVGDLATKIRDVGVQATYTEADNDYVQTMNVTLSKDLPFKEWRFPTIDDAQGQLSYRATINNLDGTSKDIDVPAATGTSFDLGEKFEAFLEVNVVPELLDWTKLKLVNVSLQYDDDANDVHHATDIIVREGGTPDPWKVPIVDEAKRAYTVTTTYFLETGERKVVGPVEETAKSLFPELTA